jgi:hypothetical protein
MAGHVTQLYPSSEEYGEVQHKLQVRFVVVPSANPYKRGALCADSMCGAFLQLCLRSTDVKELSVWSVGNPHLNLQFERRVSGKTVQDAWVDVATLDTALNPVQDVCTRGFKMPADGSGAMFTVGNIRFPSQSSGPCWCPRVSCELPFQLI